MNSVSAEVGPELDRDPKPRVRGRRRVPHQIAMHRFDGQILIAADTDVRGCRLCPSIPREHYEQTSREDGSACPKSAYPSRLVVYLIEGCVRSSA